MPLPKLLLNGASSITLPAPASQGTLRRGAAGGGGVAPPPPAPAFLEAFQFLMQRQQQTNWCWAAVAVSVFEYWERRRSLVARLLRLARFTCARLLRSWAARQWWTQCELVNYTLGVANCCHNGACAGCNRPWYLHEALQVTGNLQQLTHGQAPLNVVVQQVRAGAPLGVLVHWPGGGAHVFVVRGYGPGFFLVEDPWYGATVWASGTPYRLSGSWAYSYFTGC